MITSMKCRAALALRRFIQRLAMISANFGGSSLVLARFEQLEVNCPMSIIATKLPNRPMACGWSFLEGFLSVRVRSCGPLLHLVRPHGSSCLAKPSARPTKPKLTTIILHLSGIIWKYDPESLPPPKKEPTHCHIAFETW